MPRKRKTIPLEFGNPIHEEIALTLLTASMMCAGHAVDRLAFIAELIEIHGTTDYEFSFSESPKPRARKAAPLKNQEGSGKVN